MMNLPLDTIYEVSFEIDTSAPRTVELKWHPSEESSLELEVPAPLAQMLRSVSDSHSHQTEGLKDTDVLCGRDRRAHHHPGNRRFRHLVQQHCNNYQSLSTRDSKSSVTREVIDAVHAYGGRFVKIEDDGALVILDEASTHDKVSHALRSSRCSHMSSGARQVHESDPAMIELLRMQREIFEEMLRQSS